jgi:site-specific DNA-methyltransferase (cytosine-N4-specific)
MGKKLYSTKNGDYYIGDSEKTLTGKLGRDIKGKVNLIVTSPPFPLNKKKKYGNRLGKEYKDWLVKLAKIFSNSLADDGSIVIELGNSWEPGRPVQSTLGLEALLELVNAEGANLRLCQQFVCYNPSRLPSPAQWVTVNRIRTIDSFTHVWWLSKTDFPKANNSKVLRPYSKSMKHLLKRKKYNAGTRPSEHKIGEKSFLTNHGGSIMHNVLEIEQIDPSKELRLPENMFSMSNTNSNDFFLQTCRKKGVKPHPARMQPSLVSFFVDFLTDPGDLVLDPFAGSNTTGYVAEKFNRKWVAIEIDEQYGEQSRWRFDDPDLK